LKESILHPINNFDTYPRSNTLHTHTTMALTNQIAHSRKKTECSFCGGVGHNRRGCEIASFARCFFLDPLDTDPEKARKCSSCGLGGHYCTTCPFVQILQIESAPAPPLGENPRPQNSNPNRTLCVGPVVPKPRPLGSKRRPVPTLPPLALQAPLATLLHAPTAMGARWPLDTHTIGDLYIPVECVEIDFL
jgi:hypothetical protein